MSRPFTHDTWAPLSFVPDLGPGDGQTLPGPVGQASWLEYDDARRLTAYRILAAMRDNTYRFHLPERMWQHHDRATGLSERERVAHYLAALDEASPAEKFREYGDPMLLVAQARSLMLGDSQEVVLPDLQRLLKAGADEGRAGASETEQDDAQPGAADQQAQVKRLQTFDQYLQDWQEAERLPLRLQEGEENTVGDGDGMYALGWSKRLGRPVLQVHDPGFYFPDLDTVGPDDEYPTVVHAAWEYERRSDKHTILHRETWRLVPVAPGDDYEGPRFDDLPDRPTAAYKVPWSDVKADRFLVYEVAEWDTAALQPTETVYTLTPDSRTLPSGRVEPQPYLIDFLPVVHVPNDAAGKRHFGRSVLLSVAQLLPDLASSDTDLQANSELSGSSPTVVTGAPGFQPNAGPGNTWDLPAGADAKLIDTSRTLVGLTGYVKHLLSRLSTNTRLAEPLLGRVAPNDVPSGYALELGFAPTRSLVREMRMVRDEKYPLLLKMVLRLGQVYGGLPPGETPRAVIALGGYLPADRAAAVSQVKDGLSVHAFSHATAVQILMDAGFPIEDAEAEVEQIKREAFDDMVKLVEALGVDGETRVREWLGIRTAADLLGQPGGQPPGPGQPPAGQ